MVVAASVGATPHADDPSGFGHLIVDLAQGGRHLVRERAGDDHDVGLARRSSENDTQSILIVSRRGQVHHFDGTAGETEGHWPERRLPCPVGNLIECRQGVLHHALLGLLARQRHLLSLAGDASMTVGRNRCGILLRGCRDRGDELERGNSQGRVCYL